MSVISIAEVHKLAQLSGLKITDEQAIGYAEELNEILNYFEQLKAVDTEGIEPTYQVNGRENVMREDEIIDYGVDQGGLLKNAPKTRDGSIEVPRVIE